MSTEDDLKKLHDKNEVDLEWAKVNNGFPTEKAEDLAQIYCSCPRCSCPMAIQCEINHCLCCSG